MKEPGMDNENCKSIAALLRTGISLVNSDQYEEAIACYQQAWQRMDQTGVSWTELIRDDRELLLKALVHMRIIFNLFLTGRREEELIFYRETLQRVDRAGISWAEFTCEERILLLTFLVGAGVILDDAGQHDEAITCYSGAIQRIDQAGLSWIELSSDERVPLLKSVINQVVSLAHIGKRNASISTSLQGFHRIADMSVIDWATFSPSEKSLLSALCLNYVLTTHQSDAPENTWRLYFLSQPSCWRQRDFKSDNYYTPATPQSLTQFSEFWLRHQGKQPTTRNQVSLRDIGIAHYLYHDRQRHRALAQLRGVVLAQVEGTQNHLKKCHEQDHASKRAAQRNQAILRLLSRKRWWWQRRALLKKQQTVPIPNWPDAKSFETLCRNCAHDLASLLLADHQIPDGPETLGEILLAGSYWEQRPVPDETGPIWQTGLPPWEMDTEGFYHRLVLLCQIPPTPSEAVM